MRTDLFYSSWRNRFWQMERGAQDLKLYADQLETLGLKGIADQIRSRLWNFDAQASICRQEWEHEIEPIIRKADNPGEWRR